MFNSNPGRVLLLCLIVGCNGCKGLGGNSGTPFTALSPIPDGKALIYLYRPSSPVMGFAYPDITLDGVEVESVRNGGYTIYPVLPGEHDLVIEPNGFWALPRFETKIQISEGERHFYRITADAASTVPYGGIVNVSFGGKFWHVPEHIALEELPELSSTTDEN